MKQRYDVVVVGLGTAGSIAAIAAARRGLRVLGVDRHTCMGGVGTAGGVVGYYLGTRGGLYEEIDRRVPATERQVFTPSFGVNAEGKQYVLEREAVEAGATIRYDTTVTAVRREGTAVRGVECFSPDTGRYEVACSVVIDGTGNADVCRLAGCELRGGRAFDGQAQPFSNVWFRMKDNRVQAAYTDSGYVFPEDPESLSRAIVDSALLSTHLKDRFEEEPRLIRVAPQLGVRESRFIAGEEDVTLDDFLHDRYTRQPVFMAYSNLDNHSKDLAFESELQRDWTVAASLWGLRFSVPIPLGALIPRGYDGLIVAGRCLAVDHDLAACVRMKRDMQKCGEAAACAAFLSIEKGVPVRDVPYPELAKLLRETDCLPERHEVYFEQRLAEGDTSNPLIRWIEDPGELKAGLSGVKPGVAIWSARRLGDAVRPRLLEWMRDEASEHLQKHSAIALALLRDPAAAPVLRDIVRERDPFFPSTSVKYNQSRGYAAVYLLGKLADKDAIPELRGILEQREAFAWSERDKEFLSDAEEVRFQYVSYALTSLSRIGDRHAETRQDIADVFHQAKPKLDDSLSITFKGSAVLRNPMDDKLRRLIDETLERWDRA
ncbi:FAD-dependent oxidoreductase [Paenibacillus sp.]|uniref:FAD-dependent oxidoreductase n=1 Tax=Paenibacillus sp. TaxID=58172 RepID=UPI0028114F63|nr:FAD-dependent oxidoreductase [Paenibacillus sp.]